MKTETCRLCNQEALQPFLDYGEVALADSFLDSEKAIAAEKKYPLKLCLCPHCKHTQIDEIVDPSLLFEHYPWETGISSSMTKFAQELFHQTISCYELVATGRAPRVLEIASNDGSILSEFKRNNCEVLGVDPAKNIVKIANERGIKSLAEFFHLPTANRIVKEYGKWDICLARNVLAHVKDLHGVAEGIKTVLTNDGFGIIEVPHLKKMFEELQYDQVFHEHLGYHSLDSIQRLFKRYDMEVFDVQEIWIHGGSIRVFIQSMGGPRKISQRVPRILAEEKELGLYEERTWKEFAQRALTHKKLLRGELTRLKLANRRIAIYGASAKGQSLLQFCGVDHTLIDFVVDKSKMKQNKWTPGTHIRILPPPHIYEARPDVVLLCAWNFAKEIMEQEKQFIADGGKFLHPFPSPHYLN